jgi:hypothetical protein
MDRWATKDRYERETEESERLVRPAPKVKPPRHDRQRETMRPDQDPDIDADPDIARDKDLSLNYKNIGGSIVSRVVSRFYFGHDPIVLRVAARFVRTDIVRDDDEKASGSDEYVSVINKETGEPTHVKKETLHGPGGAKYEVVKDEEKKKEPESKPSITEETAAKVRELAEKHPQLKGMLNVLADPKHKEHTTLTALSALPLANVLKGVEFPEGIKTVGDLQAVAQAGAEEAPKGKKKQKGKPSESPRAPPQEKKPEGPEAEEPGSEPEKAWEAPEGPPAGALPPRRPKKPTDEDEYDYEYGGPSSKDKAALKNWVAEKGHEQPEFKAWEKKQKTVSEKDGQALYPSKDGGKVPFAELPTSAQAKIKARYEQDVKSERNSKALKELASSDPATKKLLRDLANPNSELRTRIENEAREERRDLDESDVGKTIAEAAHLKLPDTISSAQDLIDAAEKGFAPPPEPERPKANRQESARAEAAIEETLPEDIAEQVSSMGLHPHDVSDLLSGYHAAMNVDLPEGGISEVADGLSKGGGYHLDVENLEPPEEFYLDGEKVKFGDMSPEDQSEVFAKYKMHVLATSLAARQRVSDSLAEAGLPEGPAKIISDAMLRSGGKDIDDGVLQEFFSKSLATAFAEQPMDPDEIKKVFETVGDSPMARKLVAAYVQASNYVDVRNKYLSDPETRITEHDDPAKIARKLEEASEYLKERSESIPEDARIIDPAMEFRNRVMDRMGYLAGDKVPFIREYLKDYEMKDFEANKKQAEKRQKDFDELLDKEIRAIELEHGTREVETDLDPKKKFDEELAGPRKPSAEKDKEEAIARLKRDKGISPPTEPVQPPGYDLWKNRKKVEESSKSALDFLRGLFKRNKETGAKQASLTVEQIVALRYLIGRRSRSYSSYPGIWTMGQLPPGVHTAVYWGQAPYEQTAPYEQPTQLHARDFGDQDFDAILKAAREWLKLPVLSREIKGLYPDTQLRAALDLAIRDHDNGKYSVGLYPTVYNELLAKLSGRPGPYELLTGKPDAVPGVKNAGKSTYRATTERGLIMKASSQVRTFASRAAGATPDPELAFDLMAFADHLAAEEAQSGQAQEQSPQQSQTEQQKQAAIRIAAQHVNKFTAVRSLVIRQAAQNPQARELFLPILQALKA